MAWKVVPSSGTGAGDIVRISNDEENLARGSRGCRILFRNQTQDSVTVQASQSGQRVNRGIDTTAIQFTEEAGQYVRKILTNAARLKLDWDGTTSNRIRSVAVQSGSVAMSPGKGTPFDLVESDTAPAEEVTITVYSKEGAISVSGSLKIYDCTDSDEGTLVFTIPITTDISGELRVDPERLDFEPDLASAVQTFRVYSNLAWTLQQQGSSGFSCRPSQGGGGVSGGEAVQVTKMGANDTRTAKTATLTISNGEEVAQVIVSQTGQLIAEAEDLTAIDLNAEQDTLVRTVRTNAEKVTVRLKSGDFKGRLSLVMLSVSGDRVSGSSLPQTTDVCGPTESPKEVEIGLTFSAGYKGADATLEVVALVGSEETVIGEIKVSESGIAATPLQVLLPADGTEQEVTIDSATAWTATIQTDVYDINGEQVYVTEE